MARNKTLANEWQKAVDEALKTPPSQRDWIDKYTLEHAQNIALGLATRIYGTQTQTHRKPFRSAPVLTLNSELAAIRNTRRHLYTHTGAHPDDTSRTLVTLNSAIEHLNHIMTNSIHDKLHLTLNPQHTETTDILKQLTQAATTRQQTRTKLLRNMQNEQIKHNTAHKNYRYYRRSNRRRRDREMQQVTDKHK